MAYTTGTATNYKDLLQKFRDYITGADTSPIADRGWTVLRDTSTTSPEPSDYEMIFRGHGDSSPAKEIFFGIQTYFDSGVGYYNWELRGMTGFNDGSPVGSVTFDNQPGISPRTYIPLQNSSMNYWFYATGRRVCMIVKTGTAYQFMYAGFIDPNAFDNEWPYPLLIMGSSHDSTRLFSSNSIDYSSSINPSGDGTTTENTDNSVAYLRSVDGSWYPVKNVYGSAGNEFAIGNYGFHVSPLMAYNSLNYSSENVMTNSVTFNNVLYKNSQGGTPAATLFPADDPSGVKRKLYRLVIFMNSPSKLIAGEIHNVFWVSAGGGATAEDVITDVSTSPNDTYTVFQNIHRTDNWCFLAIKDS